MLRQNNTETLKELITTSEKLYEIILSLASIEAKNPFNPEEYLKKLAEYCLFEQKENNLIAALNINIMNGGYYLSYVLGSNLYLKAKQSDFITNDAKEGINRMHLADKIAKIIYNDNKKTFFESKEEFVNLSERLGSELCNLYIYFLEQELSKHPEEERKELILQKYKIDYLKQRINTPYDYFRNSDGLIINKKSIDLIGPNYKAYNAQFTTIIFNRLSHSLSTKDDDIKNIDKKLEFIERILLLKAVLVYSDDMVYSTMMNQLYRNTRNDHYNANSIIFDKLSDVDKKRKELVIK